jgi:hypothetical protein
LENTRAKLKFLEDRLRALDGEPVTNIRTRELTRQSLKKVVNQLKEEIIRFEAHQAAPTKEARVRGVRLEPRAEPPLSVRSSRRPIRRAGN